MRVLVVEDDPDLGRQLSEGLTQAGYATDLAKDGERCAAAELAARDRPALGPAVAAY